MRMFICTGISVRAQDRYGTTNSHRERINWLIDRRWDGCHVGSVVG
jgi:hypothetical protein